MWSGILSCNPQEGTYRYQKETLSCGRRRRVDSNIPGEALPIGRDGSCDLRLGRGVPGGHSCTRPGMDGFALQAELANRQTKVPIVFITAHDDELLREKALAAGAVDFLTKPFDYSELIEVVEAAMDSDAAG